MNFFRISRQIPENSDVCRFLFNRGSVGLGEDLELSSTMRFEAYSLTVSYSLTVLDSQKLLEDPCERERTACSPHTWTGQA